VQVKRHLEFVDQLVKDKAELSSRCERLVEDLKLLERKFEQRLQEAEERAQRELKKQRESILAAEKMRRDAWMQVWQLGTPGWWVSQAA
jgi:5-azacytidine-induced protein 1